MWMYGHSLLPLLFPVDRPQAQAEDGLRLEKN